MGKVASSQSSQAADPAESPSEEHGSHSPVAPAVVRPLSGTVGPSGPPSESDARLQRAVDQKYHLKVAAHFEEKQLLYQLRLVCCDPDRPDAFWAQFIRGDRPALIKMIEARTLVEAGITVDGARLAFATRILDRNNRLWVNGTVKVEGILFEWPQQLEEVQRRGAPRLTLPPTSGISVKLFRAAGSTNTPGVYKDGADLNAELWDLSRGGACFLCPYTKSITDITPEEPLAVGLNYHGTRVLLEARLAYRRTLSGAVRMGVRFVRSATEPPGSQEALSRVVQELEGRLHHRLFASVRKAAG